MRRARQAKILILIEENEVETQEQLAVILNNNGFKVTQATVSRDIKELHLIKIPTSKGKYKYAVPAEDQISAAGRRLTIIRTGIEKITPAENLIVINVFTNCGPAVCDALKHSGFKHMLGCLADNDMVLVILDKKENVDGFLNRLKEMKS